MLNKYIASASSILILVILGQPDSCLCSGECFFLKQCLEKKGADFTGLTISFNTQYSIRQTWEAFCRNVDNLVDCYEPSTVTGCPSLASIIPYVPSKVQLKRTYQQTCAQIDSLIELTICFQKSGVTSSVGICFNSFLNEVFKNPEKYSSPGCGGTEDPLSECVKTAIQGKCSQKAIDFVSTPLTVMCSTGSKVLAHMFTLLCVYMFLRIFTY
ncbi:unnamed protein product [Mytilus edulis]|uniref:DUF19 domain-containing protein n=1 Tax=Mytilus edulis TaxID=6550 RepID=A0A8S3Q8G7_MYTED|nr:unnamed protein product [Mytilus edulis]